MPVDNLGAAGQPVARTRARAGLPRDRQEPPPRRLARVAPLRLRNRRLVLPFLLSRLKAHTFLLDVGRWRRFNPWGPAPHEFAPFAAAGELRPRRTPPIHRHPPSYGVKVGQPHLQIVNICAARQLTTPGPCCGSGCELSAPGYRGYARLPIVPLCEVGVDRVRPREALAANAAAVPAGTRMGLGAPPARGVHHAREVVVRLRVPTPPP
jgi:hypothetical protein